ncbi:FtsX-like permease family protein [Wenzhouxiangella sp. EGI_FJ10305]|uniref:FtsX-like permease family protein n=1 Tax=Wenzhouxiangella sp. EGI_FJ10305 TaxID=3243768 RepID=UPI0035D6F647
MIGGLLLDLRHAARLYLKTPWQSALAVIMMAVAMALVSGMASLWSELYDPHPAGIEAGDDLLTFGPRADDRFGGTLGAGLIKDFASSSQTLTGLTGESGFSRLPETDIDGRPVDGQAAPVMPGYFELLEPRVRLGRGLREEDFADGGARVMVLGHRFWQDHFDGDTDIVGREVAVGEDQWRIVGVLAPEFNGVGASRFHFWAPYESYFRLIQTSVPPEMVDRIPMWKIFGRKSEGIGTAAVEAELDRFLDQLSSAERSMAPKPGELMAISGLVENPRAHRSAQRQVTMLLIATVLIALVAAVNVGIFLLARAPARQRELALRQTVGATRRRLAGQLLVEAAVLVLLGSALGVLLSIWLAAGFREMRFLEGAAFTGSWLNLPAIGYSSALATVLTLLVALVPIVTLARRTLSEGSRQFSARPGPFQHAAGLVQLGLAGLVAAAATGFMAHLWLMDQRDPGLSTEGVLAASVTFREPPTGQFQPPAEEATWAYREAVRERLLALPGVEAVSFGSPLPGNRMTAISGYNINGETIRARIINVAPGFIELLGIDLLHGRDFESAGEPGMIVSRHFAEKAWGETDVVGRTVWQDDSNPDDERGRILGVIDDVNYEHPDEPPGPLMLSGRSGFGAFMSAALIRGNPDHERVEEVINAALETHLDLLHVNEVQPVSEIVAELTAKDRARGKVTGLFGLVIVLMTAFGFFAMQRFLVDAGRRETAIRMALGAGPRSVRKYVLMQGLRLGAPGLLVGGLLALIVVAWLTNEGYVTDSVSPAVIGAAVAGGLLALMLLASLQPAVGAARLRPGDLLKEE